MEALDRLEKIPLSDTITTSLDTYTLGDKLGKGSYGAVYKCINQSNDKFAIKVFRDYRDLLCEVSMMIDVHHPAIVNIQDVYIRIDNSLHRYVDLQSGNMEYHTISAGLILPLALGDIETLNEKERNGLGPGTGIMHPVVKNNIKRFIYQLLTAIKYLHSLEIIHGDVRPKNLLVFSDNDNEYNLKLCDFSNSQYMVSDLGSTIAVPMQVLAHRPPEILLNCEDITEKTDVWATGCCIYYMITGMYLFDDPTATTSYKMMRKIIALLGITDFLKWDGSSKLPTNQLKDIKTNIYSFNRIPKQNFVSLIRNMLQYDPSKRPSMEFIIEHLGKEYSKINLHKDYFKISHHIVPNIAYPFSTIIENVQPDDYQYGDNKCQNNNPMGDTDHYYKFINWSCLLAMDYNIHIRDWLMIVKLFDICIYNCPHFKDKLDLLMVVCIDLGLIIRQHHHYTIDSYIMSCSKPYDPKEFISMQLECCEKLNYSLHYLTIYDYLEHMKNEMDITNAEYYYIISLMIIYIFSPLRELSEIDALIYLIHYCKNQDTSDKKYQDFKQKINIIGKRYSYAHKYHNVYLDY